MRDEPAARRGHAGPAAANELHAVLFDMDGLLVDTEPQWFAAETATMAWLGSEWTEADQHALLGSNLDFAADYMVRRAAVVVSPADVAAHLRTAMTEQLRRDGVAAHDGVLDLIAAVRADGLPIGLVTSSVREHVDVVLGRLGVRFDVVVTADDVTRLKPDPQPYQRAMQLLGVAPTACVVLEDSPAGVAAAHAAGCAVVAVPSVVPIEPGPGRLVLESLAAVDVELLRGLVTRS